MKNEKNKSFALNKSADEETLIKLDKAIHNSREVVFITDREGTITFINPEFTRMYGYTQEEVVGKTTPRIIKSGLFAKEVYRQFWNSLLSKQNIPSSAYVNRHKDGRLINVEGSADPILDEQGEIIGFLGIQRDISIRKKVEDDLRKSEERFSAILFSMADWVWEVDAQGVYTFSSSKGTDVLGYSHEEIIGKTPFDFMPPDEAEKIGMIFREIAGGKKPIKDLENWNIRKNGDKICLLTNGVPILDEQGNLLGYRGVDRDITKRKKDEEELRKLNALLRDLAGHLQTAREEERILIARELHDEMGQSLTALKMNLVWLNKNVSDYLELQKEKIQDSLEMVEATVKAIRRLNAELRPPILEEMGLFAAIRWQAKQFTSRSGIKHRIQIDIPDHEIERDFSINIFRIVQETLTNVSKHSEATAVEIRIGRSSQSLVITISDNGKGFAPESIKGKKAFGLAGIRERAIMMNGMVDIQSEKGKGTKVELFIPFIIRNNASDSAAENSRLK